MNITPHINPLPVATAVNPPTDSLRHENTQRPIITAPTQTSGSPAEKSATDKPKTSGLTTEQYDFTELQRSAEENANQITESSEQNQQDNNQSNEQANAEAQEKAQEEFEAEQDDKVIQQLKLRDQEVRVHEQAHASVGGATTGAPSYEYEIGPDGKQYVVAGEVSVDLSPVAGDPQATISKMEQVYAAALAPAEPSAQDMKVAAQATQLIAQARSELTTEKLDESEQVNEPRKASPYISSSGIFNANNSLESESFDQQINRTIASQEQIAPSISNDVQERADRVEGYYSTIMQANEKKPSYQFELMV